MPRDVTFHDPDLGDGIFDEDAALCELLYDDVLFANGRRYVADLGSGPGRMASDIGPETIVLFVNCNDVFYWATADAEELPLSEVRRLYEMHKRSGDYGATEWCCLRRGMRPQAPLEKRMRERGAWTAALEALPARDPNSCG